MSFSWHEIRDHLMHSSSTLSFQRNFDAIRRCQKPLLRFGDPVALLDALHCGPGTPDQKNVLLASLVEAAQSDGPAADCALTLMLLALWPGLDAVRRRSKWRCAGVQDELPSEVPARATEAVRCLDLGRVNRIAATILRNVERDIARDHQREASRQSLRSETDPDEVAADHGAKGHAISPERLHGDVARLIGADATLVIRVAVDGFSQAEVAFELGLSEAAARKRYRRATRRLREALHEFV